MSDFFDEEKKRKSLVEKNQIYKKLSLIEEKLKLLNNKKVIGIRESLEIVIGARATIDELMQHKDFFDVNNIKLSLLWNTLSQWKKYFDKSIENLNLIIEYSQSGFSDEDLNVEINEQAKLQENLKIDNDIIASIKGQIESIKTNVTINYTNSYNGYFIFASDHVYKKLKDKKEIKWLQMFKENFNYIVTEAPKYGHFFSSKMNRWLPKPGFLRMDLPKGYRIFLRIDGNNLHIYEFVYHHKEYEEISNNIRKGDYLTLPETIPLDVFERFNLAA
ncbi:MAG: hypothetical protein ABH824_06015 [Nanoarchaeota archaeon]|nr:hypothetical protein [Nanoarchaeota archaeon]MBU1875793.1 hypothetical protein [Nanoarchaeota archaeon]